MAHKKSLLYKYFSDSDCRSPRHDGHNWLIPETSLSESSGEDRSGKNTEVMKSGSTSTDTNVTNKSGSTSTDSNETIIVTSTPVKKNPHLRHFPMLRQCLEKPCLQKFLGLHT